MYYEINVALNGRHFFATHERSLNTWSKAMEVWKVFVEKFPRSEGYEVTMTEKKVHGQKIDMSNYED